MKPITLPKITRGLDVLSEEHSLPPGAVRRADDVVLDRRGGFRRRRGYELAVASPGIHSLWSEPDGLTLAANGSTLYSITEEGGAFALSSLFSGLTPDVPVGYGAENGEVWFTQPGLMGKVLPSTAVRKPGIADISTVVPGLTPFAAGGLTAGRYGVAYSLVNDLGEQSGMSDTAYVDVTSGGIILAGVVWNFGYVDFVRVYATHPDGPELYQIAEVAPADILFLTQFSYGEPARNQYLGPLSGGRYLAHYNGRTYVATGSTLEYSEPFNPGLRDLRGASIGFAEDITGLAAVDGGLFVGQGTKVLFLAGDGPKTFKQKEASPHGMIGGGPAQAASSMFDPKLAPSGEVCGVWLSDVGFVLGLPNGQAVPLQADRVKAQITGEAGTVVTTRRGIKQVISVVESMSLNGSADAADMTLS